MKSASFKNLVSLIIVMLWGASAETVRNISLVGKVRLEDMCRGMTSFSPVLFYPPFLPH